MNGTKQVSTAVAEETHSTNVTVKNSSITLDNDKQKGATGPTTGIKQQENGQRKPRHQPKEEIMNSENKEEKEQ